MRSGAAATIAALVLGALAGCGGGGGAPASAPPLPDELLGLLTGQVDCGPGAGVVLVRQHRGDFTGDGLADALLAVRCDTGAGAPPSAVFAIAARPAGPEVIDELLKPDLGEVVSGLDVTGPTAVVTAFGSSADAPRCCPDLGITHTYRWDGTAFDDGIRQATPLPEAQAKDPE